MTLTQISRTKFTPDLMPLGFLMLLAQTSWRKRRGKAAPLPGRTDLRDLVQRMRSIGRHQKTPICASGSQQKTVTVAKHRYKRKKPFFVLASSHWQMEGTYPRPSAVGSVHVKVNSSSQRQPNWWPILGRHHRERGAQS